MKKKSCSFFFIYDVYSYSFWHFLIGYRKNIQASFSLIASYISKFSVFYAAFYLFVIRSRQKKNITPWRVQLCYNCVLPGILKRKRSPTAITLLFFNNNVFATR